MNSIVRNHQKMDICSAYKNIYCFFACVVIFVSFANGAPRNHHRHQSWTSSDDDSVSKLEWVNPCGGELKSTEPTKFHNETGLRPRNPKVLTPLIEAFPLFIARLNGSHMNAIDVSHISEWFKFNQTYKFLHRINATVAAVNLPKRHIEIQKYVGAFQYLANKQKKFDRMHNEGNEKTVEIDALLVLSKNLLCEVEDVINSTRQPMPMVFSREQMDKLLSFRNNNNVDKFTGEIDELDNIFTKVRFHEYMQNLQRVLNRPGPKNLRPRKRGSKLGSTKKNKLNKGKNLSKGKKSKKGKGPRKLAKRKNLKKKSRNLSNLSLA